MKKIITLLVILLSFSMFSQRTCTTNDKLQELINTVPGYAAHHQEVMDYIQKPNNPQALLRRQANATTVVTIPVVFHILYKNANQNVSDAQIQSQLDVLNKDYRKLNTDFSTVVPSAFQTFGGDMEIVFCKATKTPTGLTTTGITRKSVSTTFSFENDYYTSVGELAWDTTKYLNIWVGSFTNTKTLGFAYLPTSAGMVNDGLCISYKAFGTMGTALSPYNKGRTGTHEIGHYFGLLHPWADDVDPCGVGDGVDDTPATTAYYSSCPSFPNNTNACTASANGSMFMNYMDYVYDACMAFFTEGQKKVMRNALAGPRLSLLSSNGCGTMGLTDFEAINAIAVYPNPVSQYFMITSPQVQIDEVELFNTLGQLVKTQKLSQTNNVINIEELAYGTYYLRIYNQGNFLKSDKIIKK